MIFVGSTPTIVMTIKEDGSALDISSATSKRITLASPDGETSVKAAEFSTDGTDGKIEYQCSTSDLDMRGTWQAQAYLEMPGWQGHCEIVKFTVYDPL